MEEPMAVYLFFVFVFSFYNIFSRNIVTSG
jgi:hypothetical protein